MTKELSINAIGEYAFHARIADILNTSKRIVGDDVAFLPPTRGQIMLTVDRLANGVERDVRARLLVTQTLSDIISSNGDPIAMLLAVQAPPDTPSDELLEFVSEVANVCKEYGCALVGGDTKEGDVFSAVGVGVGRKRPGPFVRRDAAEPGDVIVVTTVKGKLWGDRWANHLVNHFNLEVPSHLRATLSASDKDFGLPVEESQFLMDHANVHAGLDLSDGLGAGLRIIASASSVGCNIDSGSLDLLVDHETIDHVADILGIPGYCFALSPGYMWNNMYAIARDSWNSYELQNAIPPGHVFEIGTATSATGQLTLDGAESSFFEAASDEKFRAWRWEDRTEEWLRIMRGQDQ